MDRRSLVKNLGIAGATVAAGALAACGKKGGWPEGMAEIKWDRDTCVQIGRAHV